MNVPTSYDYPEDRTSIDAAYVAGDALILAISALNGADTGDRSDPLWELAVQVPGSAFQLTVDALRAVFAALLPEVDSLWIDRAISAAYDCTGEPNVTRKVTALIREDYSAEL